MIIEELPHVLAYAQDFAPKFWETGKDLWDTQYAAHAPTESADGTHVLFLESADTKNGVEADKYRGSFIQHCLDMLKEQKYSKVAAVTETRPGVVDGKLVVLFTGIYMLNSFTTVTFEMSKNCELGKLHKIINTTVAPNRNLIHHYKPLINI